MPHMKWLGVVGFALVVAGCAQLGQTNATATPTAEARCEEFSRMATDLSATAYRRAAAQEALRAQRCPGHR